MKVQQKKRRLQQKQQLQQQIQQQQQIQTKRKRNGQDRQKVQWKSRQQTTKTLRLVIKMLRLCHINITSIKKYKDELLARFSNQPM